MFNSREKLYKAIQEKNWFDIVKAAEKDWYRVGRNREPSLVYDAARLELWDVVEYCINTFKKDDSGKLDYSGLIDWIFYKIHHTFNPVKEKTRVSLIAREILANNPHIVEEERYRLDENERYLSEPFLFLDTIIANPLSKQIETFVNQGVRFLSYCDNSRDTVFRDVMPVIIRIALIDLVYRLHCDSDLLAETRMRGYSSIDHAGIAEIITPYLDFRENKKEYKVNAKKLVESQGGGFFGCLGKSEDTTIFIKRLKSMLGFKAVDIQNYIHDFVKNRFLTGNGSEKNIIPALVAHKLISQAKVDEFKREAVEVLMNDWEDIGQNATLS